MSLEIPVLLAADSLNGNGSRFAGNVLPIASRIVAADGLGQAVKLADSRNPETRVLTATQQTDTRRAGEAAGSAVTRRDYTKSGCGKQLAFGKAEEMKGFRFDSGLLRSPMTNISFDDYTEDDFKRIAENLEQKMKGEA